MDEQRSVEELERIIKEYSSLIDDYLRGVIGIGEFVDTYRKMPKITTSLPHSCALGAITKWD